MNIHTNVGILTTKTANVPNVRFVIKKHKGKYKLHAVQKKPIIYLYKGVPKKGKYKVNISISENNPIYGISKLFGLFL